MNFIPCLCCLKHTDETLPGPLFYSVLWQCHMSPILIKKFPIRISNFEYRTHSEQDRERLAASRGQYVGEVRVLLSLGLERCRSKKDKASTEERRTLSSNILPFWGVTLPAPREFQVACLTSTLGKENTSQHTTLERFPASAWSCFHSAIQ